MAHKTVHKDKNKMASCTIPGKDSLSDGAPP